MPKLEPNDIIDVVAPSGGVTSQDLSTIEEYIAKLGYKARIPDNLCSDKCSYLANDDETRHQLLIQALTCQKSKAVWCVRGGYGAARIAPKLANMTPPCTPKWLIGFSDNTALHIILNQFWNWPSIHASVLLQHIQDKIDSQSKSRVFDILKNNTSTLTFDKLAPLNEASSKADHTIDSQIVGGNMTLIQTSIGTNWQLTPTSSILFLEEINEEHYRIDRILTQLTQINLFNGVDAVIIGDIIYNTEHLSQCDAVLNWANSINVPVLHCPNIGHGTTNMPIIFNSPATLNLGNHPTLTCYHGAPQ